MFSTTLPCRVTKAMAQVGDIQEAKTSLAHAVQKVWQRPLTSTELAYVEDQDINALELFASTVMVQLPTGKFSAQGAGSSEAEAEEQAAMKMLQKLSSIVEPQHVQAPGRDNQESPDAQPVHVSEDGQPAQPDGAPARPASPEVRPMDCKGILTRVLQKVLRRPITKEDLQFESVSIGIQPNQTFHSSAIITLGTSGAQKFPGDQSVNCLTKKEAEQEAAWAALKECPDFKGHWEQIATAATGGSQTASAEDTTDDAPEVLAEKTSGPSTPWKPDAHPSTETERIRTEEDDLPASRQQLIAWGSTGTSVASAAYVWGNFDANGITRWTRPKRLLPTLRRS